MEKTDHQFKQLTAQIFRYWHCSLLVSTQRMRRELCLMGLDSDTKFVWAASDREKALEHIWAPGSVLFHAMSGRSKSTHEPFASDANQFKQSVNSWQSVKLSCSVLFELKCNRPYGGLWQLLMHFYLKSNNYSWLSITNPLQVREITVG